LHIQQGAAILVGPHLAFVAQVLYVHLQAREEFTGARLGKRQVHVVLLALGPHGLAPIYANAAAHMAARLVRVLGGQGGRQAQHGHNTDQTHQGLLPIAHSCLQCERDEKRTRPREFRSRLAGVIAYSQALQALQADLRATMQKAA
jgi:hypothetical protein